MSRHVALLQVQGKEFEMTPIPLRTVRPFVLEEITLTEIADEEGLDLTDSMAISKYLKVQVTQIIALLTGCQSHTKVQVNTLIEKANTLWDERNARAVAEGEEELPPMIPLIRLKARVSNSFKLSDVSSPLTQVDTTGVSEMSNPVRFGQEFQGRVANPRDVLVFHRSKKLANRNAKVTIDEPELGIDDPALSVSEKLAKMRVQTLVQEYLAAQELQVLGETGMSDAIQIFVEKDDTHAIQS
jgi:double-strand break repair protein MRE11